MTSRRRFGIEGEKIICVKEEGVESGNNLMTL